MVWHRPSDRLKVVVGMKMGIKKKGGGGGGEEETEAMVVKKKKKGGGEEVGEALGVARRDYRHSYLPRNLFATQ